MRRAIVTALLVAIGVACGSRLGPAPAPTLAPDQPIVLPTALPNGRIELAIQPAYRLGQPAVIQATVIATSGTISGPVAAQVYASGIGEGGRPSEVLVRALSVTPAAVAAGQRRTFALTWDGRDDHGTLVPSDAYVLIVEFRVDDGGGPRTARATATLQMND